MTEATTPPPNSRKPRKLLQFLIKLALAALLVGWLAGPQGWRKISASLAAIPPGAVALGVLIYLGGQSLCAWKWGVLARALGFRQPFRYFWAHYFSAMFVSLFLPTGVGGDVYRTAVLARHPEGGDRTGALISVLADRGTGVLALAWIAAVAAWLSPVVGLPPGVRYAVLGACGVLTLGFLAPFAVRPPAAGKPFWVRVFECWRHPHALAAAVGAALVFQVLACTIFLLLGSGMGLKVSPAFYFLACPVAALASMIPLTFNGLGERTTALVVLFGMAGVGREPAVALGLAWTAVLALASLVGGLFLLRGFDAPPSG